MLVITLGYPVLLDIEGSSLTQGVLKLFRRKLKNSIKIALIVKAELTLIRLSFLVYQETEGGRNQDAKVFEAIFYTRMLIFCLWPLFRHM